MSSTFSEYAQVQRIAKETMEYARSVIVPGMNLPELRELLENRMLSLGADSFWYWNVGAFLFAGDETAVSVSGREYRTSDRIIAENDIVTIDLSPQTGDVWGDYARTVILENGNVVSKENTKNKEWRSGLLMEDLLHRELIDFAVPETTFEELFFHINDLIRKKGFMNLDFLGNLGHSIARNRKDRVYTEKGNRLPLRSAGYFTFEPHIGIPGSRYGYKKENIYYFKDGRLNAL